MTAWFYLTLFVFIFVGHSISPKKGAFAGFVVWLIVSAIIVLLLAAERGFAAVFVLGSSVVLSFLSSIYSVKLLCRFDLGKKWMKIDHQGAGCMTHSIIFIISFYLVEYILEALFL